jgi:hypothetical protein
MDGTGLGRRQAGEITYQPPSATCDSIQMAFRLAEPASAASSGHSGLGHDPRNRSGASTRLIVAVADNRPERRRSCKRLAARSLLQRRPAARYCRTRATASELLSFTFTGWGACPDTGTSTMIGKIIVGLAAVAIVSVGTTMTASAQQMSASAQQKKITVAIPRQVCEMLNVDTQNWGRQTVQLCGPPGGPRGQATIKQPRLKPMAPGK